MSPNTTPSAPTAPARRPACLPLRARAGEVDSGVVGIVWSPIGGSGFSFDLIVGREASRAESRRLQDHDRARPHRKLLRGSNLPRRVEAVAGNVPVSGAQIVRHSEGQRPPPGIEQ